MNSVAIAQQAKTRTVVGSVIDFETGEPIIGASVAVAGKSVGTISDLDGNFSIRVDGDNTKLEISFYWVRKTGSNGRGWKEADYSFACRFRIVR
ncbi:carboxypeptidase-like regulatory domain-containing protein [Bacteroides ovatus]|nr:carboxypeptidase-like regulatory domain-containing protein [Bacteroides ovatus]